MSAAFQTWIEQAAVAGVMACGVRGADRSVSVRSCHPEVSEPCLNEVMQNLAEMAQALQQHRITVQSMCWTFENYQVWCVARPGGVLAAVVARRDGNATMEVDRLLSLFLQPPS